MGEIEEEGAIIRVIVTAQKTVVRQKGALFKITANTERDVIHQTQEVVVVGDLEDLVLSQDHAQDLVIDEEIEKHRDQDLGKGNVVVGAKENNANEKEEIENVRKGKESENEKEKENVEMKKDVGSVKG